MANEEHLKILKQGVTTWNYGPMSGGRLSAVCATPKTRWEWIIKVASKAGELP